MDYLDPKKRRAYHIRLMVGYVLVAIVIGLAAYLLTTAANGYGFNAQTGQVIQNGLLFVDSNPGGANIILNGEPRGTTPSRLIVPGGNYTLTIKRSGYRDWSRQFTLNGQGVARYIYPFLFPVNPVITTLKNYTSSPRLITESPSQRWLLVENNTASVTVPTFDEYDTTTLDKTSPTVQQISLPASLLTDYSPQTSQLTAVEWSTDNNNILLEHNAGKKTEFVVFDRADPAKSFNVNTLFKVDPAKVSLFNKKAAQLYIYLSDRSLRLGTVSSGQLAAPLLKDVLAYKSYGTDLITYVTGINQAPGMVQARIWNLGKTYPLYQFKAGTNYLIDAAQFNGHFYYLAGSNTADRINIYEDPLTDIQNPAVGKALPMLAMHDPGANIESFSNNARFAGVEAGQSFAVYDFETQTLYQYSVKQPLAAEMSWMDGNRLIGDSGGKVFVIDFDDTNSQLVTATVDTAGALFSANYRHMLTIAAGTTKGSVVLEDVDMRAGADLPASKASISTHYHI